MSAETLVRSLGGLLQLAGVWTVAWEIHKTHQRFAPERVGRLQRRAQRVWRRLLRRKPEPVTVQLVGSALELEHAMSANLTVTRDPDELDLKGKVDELLRREQQLQEELTRVNKEHGDQLREHSKRLAEERTERTQADDDLVRRFVAWRRVASASAGTASRSSRPD